MKRSILILVAAVALMMSSCKENPYMPSPGSTDQVPDSMPELKYPDPTPDPDTVEVPAGAITVYEARQICKKLASGENTTEKYYVKGWVFRLDAKHADGVASYGNGTFYIAATNDGKTDKYPFEAYQVMGRGGQKLTSADQVAEGDFVVIYGQIMNYSGTAETVGKGAAYIYSSSNVKFNSELKPVEPADTIHATCAEAKAAALAMASGATSKDVYVVEGYVQSAGYSNEISKGQQKWFWLDETKNGNKVLEAYWCNVPDGTTPVPVGAKIRLTGHLMNYNGNTAEIKNGNIEILNEEEAVAE